MSICPDCDSKLEKRRGRKVRHKMYSGEIVTGYRVKWYCPKCKRIKKNSKAELMALGRLNQIANDLGVRK